MRGRSWSEDGDERQWHRWLFQPVQAGMDHPSYSITPQLSRPITTLDRTRSVNERIKIFHRMINILSRYQSQASLLPVPHHADTVP